MKCYITLIGVYQQYSHVQGWISSPWTGDYKTPVKFLYCGWFVPVPPPPHPLPTSKILYIFNNTLTRFFQVQTQLYNIPNKINLSDLGHDGGCHISVLGCLLCHISVLGCVLGPQSRGCTCYWSLQSIKKMTYFIMVSYCSKIIHQTYY